MREYLNIDYLLVLKIDSSGKLIIDQIKTIDPIGKKFYFITKWIKDRNFSAIDVLEKIKKDSLFKELLFTKFNYCIELDGSFQELSSDYQTVIAKYPYINPKSNNYDEINYNQKKFLLKDLTNRSFALALDYTYDVCEEQLKNKEILCYSHRNRGWSAPVFHLNKNFDLEIATNFGYGSSSYFFTIIIYRGIQIVPFSEWVLYQYAKFYDIVRYSSIHPLADESWIDAFEYVKDAVNLALEDEKSFVDKYLIEECEKMVSGIENFLVGDTFRFLDVDNKLKEVRKEGHELIEFRGEKITGALDFIQNIILLDKIASVNEFIKRIEKCNIKVKPMLKKEIKLINSELIPLEQIKLKMLPKYQKSSNEIKFYKNMKIKFRSILNDENDDKINIDVDKIFSTIYPKYPIIVAEYDQINKEFKKIDSQIINLKNIKSQILSYLGKIDNYF